MEMMSSKFSREEAFEAAAAEAKRWYSSMVGQSLAELYYSCCGLL